MQALVARIRSHVPGVALVALVTALAIGLRQVPGLSVLSPMILGIALGVLIGNLAPLPRATAPGVRFAGRGILRFSVGLLGLQITLTQLAGQGLSGLLSAALVVFATFGVMLALGRLLGVGRDLRILIAAGTSVCGAAAIGGVNGLLRAKDEDVTYAVGAITLFGTLGMFGAPALLSALGIEGEAFGRFIGLSLHEVAQVVAAGFQGGEAAGQEAVIVKLTRVILLAPLIFLLAFALRGKGAAGQGRGALLPWFVAMFLGLAAIHSLGVVPEGLRAFAVGATPWLMTAALTALGLGTRFASLRAAGWQPLVLCAGGSFFIAALAMMLI